MKNWMFRAMAAGFLGFGCSSCSSPVDADAGADAGVDAVADAGAMGDTRPPPGYTESAIAPMCDDLSTVGVRPIGWSPAVDMRASSPQMLPFSFPFFGIEMILWSASENGVVRLHTQAGIGGFVDHTNLSIPNRRDPNSILAAFWDYLIAVPGTDMRSATFGDAPARTFVVEWSNLTFFEMAERDARLTFQAKLIEATKAVEFHYCTLTPGATPDLVTGSSATIGLESSAALYGIQHSFDTPMSVSTATAIRFTPTP